MPQLRSSSHPLGFRLSWNPQVTQLPTEHLLGLAQRPPSSICTVVKKWSGLTLLRFHSRNMSASGAKYQKGECQPILLMKRDVFLGILHKPLYLGLAALFSLQRVEGALVCLCSFFMLYFQACSPPVRWSLELQQPGGFWQDRPDEWHTPALAGAHQKSIIFMPTAANQGAK